VRLCSVRRVPGRIPLLLLAPVLAGALVTGCGAGDVVDDQKTELSLRYDIAEATGEKVKSVDCPADVPVSTGTRFVCSVTTTSGLEAVAEIEITSNDADLKVLSLEKP